MQNTKKRGVKVLYENKEYFIDMNAQQFQDTRNKFPHVNVKIFHAAPFYNENSIGSHPLSELLLITDDPADLSKNGIEFLKDMIRGINSNYPRSKTAHISGAKCVIKYLTQPFHNELLEALHILRVTEKDNSQLSALLRNLKEL